MLIKASAWTPDQADLGSAGMIVATNCLPGSNSYRPFPAFSSATGTIDAYARGAIDLRDKDLNVYQYVGNQSKIYELNGDTWSDVSLGGGYATASEEKWEFAQWKNVLIATLTPGAVFLEEGHVAKNTDDARGKSTDDPRGGLEAF